MYLDKQCFFVTTTCNRKQRLIEASNSYSMLEESLNFVSKKYDVRVFGYVIMPNHLHLITYFAKENRLSDYMRDFKKFTSTNIRQRIEQLGDAKLLNQIRFSSPNRVFKVWTDRFDDVYLESKKLLEIKLDYIHDNPLQERWNLTRAPETYPYSSASFYERGLMPGVRITDYREFF